MRTTAASLQPPPRIWLCVLTPMLQQYRSVSCTTDSFHMLCLSELCPAFTGLKALHAPPSAAAHGAILHTPSQHISSCTGGTRQTLVCKLAGKRSLLQRQSSWPDTGQPGILLLHGEGGHDTSLDTQLQMQDAVPPAHSALHSICTLAICSRSTYRAEASRSIMCMLMSTV